MRLLLVSLVVVATGVGFCATPEAADRPIEYNRDIRPIFVENCFACHGPDSAARKADLRLDQREAAIKAEAFVPGQPDKSALIERIFNADADQVMPPTKTEKKLTAAQKELLKKWIAAGAKYQLHWSFIPPKKVSRDAESSERSAWARNAIDYYILAQLKAHGLTPAPEAGRRTLARRLSLDLTGLIPDPADVDAFVNDKSADWYEKYVDKLMASPHWGEHRARYWLDAARYADTNGIHFDNYREIWAYRDWVIRAFNANMHFDEFTIEQLAGDLLPNATLDQKIATGFNRCNITTNEGGAINEEYLVLYTRDRTETASQVWLGLTMGCAVCHDHKLDPLSQREFYSLAAFFNNTTQAAMDGNVQNTPPVLPVPRQEDRARSRAIAKELTEIGTKLGDRRKAARAEFDDWRRDASAATIAELIPIDGLQAHMPLAEGNGKSTLAKIGDEEKSLDLPASYVLSPAKDGPGGLQIKSGESLQLPEIGDFDKDQSFSVSLWVFNAKKNQNGALVARMDDAHGYRGWDVWVQGDRIGSHVIHQWPGDAVKVVSKNPIAPKKWVHVTVTYDGSAKASGLRIYYDGKPQPVNVEADRLTQTTRTEVPFSLGQRHVHERLQNATIGDLRIYSRVLNNGEIEQLAKSSRAAAVLSKDEKNRTPAERDELFAWWLVSLYEPYRALDQRLGALKQEDATIKSRGTVAHVMNEKPAPPMAYILNRGEYDQRRDAVTPGTPKILPAFPSDLPRNRLGLARWLLRPENPLTSRVIVNRYWQELFGQGLVRTSGDFGTAGELPSHPELLDWLAIEFREGGWDTKKFFKMLVCSATYRQAAITTPEKREKDPFNRLLSRGPRFRMDAEMIRDNALEASGLLVGKIGGPSVKPYQPEGVWEAVAMPESNTHYYKRDKGESLYRRSIYTFWKRAAPPASLEILNAPNRETCAVRRERTDTPLQALVTLNDPQYVEAARHLAQLALQQKLDDAGRIDFVSLRVLARPMRPEEHAVVRKSLDKLLAHYREHGDDAAKLLAVGDSPRDAKLDAATHAAWTMLCNEIMNLDEAMNK